MYSHCLGFQKGEPLCGNFKFKKLKLEGILPHGMSRERTTEVNKIEKLTMDITKSELMLKW